jgi:NADH-quinone oxidoreductase subunit M
VVATTAIVSGAIYFLWAYQRVFHGQPDAANAAVKDISWREILAVAPLLAGIVFLGVYPKPFLDRVTPSVGNLLGHVEHVAPNAGVPAGDVSAVKYTVPANQDVDAPPGSGATPSGPGSAAGAHNGSGAK